MSGQPPGSLRIAFIHPDLGLGGAERLVLDAALALAARGHRVVLFTAELDSARAFADVHDPALDIRVRGKRIPKHVGQRLRVVCSIARMSALSIAVRREGPFDAVFCDLVAHVLPLLKTLVDTPVLFYGHYPDRLLTPAREGLYRGYRVPFDWLEARGLEHTDRLVVNSEFTAVAFRRAFPALANRDLPVVYPCVSLPETTSEPPHKPIRLLMIGRFSPAKNLSLLVRAGVALAEHLPAETFAQVRFVIAGGYDPALEEARAVESELRTIADAAGLGDRLELHRSPDEATKVQLLQDATCVVYTPTDEHLGIVPLEAMAAARPVIAVDRGGPRETVLQGVSGVLCEPTPHAFARAIGELLQRPQRAREMGLAGRAHVAKAFSRDTLGRHLELLIRGLL
ncbi:MAG: glycosyltransferase [Myxococcales bacterium]|nr:glycosyltransferase [Myxococcales bacterium]